MSFGSRHGDPGMTPDVIEKLEADVLAVLEALPEQLADDAQRLGNALVTRLEVTARPAAKSDASRPTAIFQERVQVNDPGAQ